MGLGAYILYNRMPAGADPLGPENILGFCSGWLTGTGGFISGRWKLVGKSPLTGGWGDANCGGTFSPAIKHCGFDAIDWNQFGWDTMTGKPALAAAIFSASISSSLPSTK